MSIQQTKAYVLTVGALVLMPWQDDARNFQCLPDPAVVFPPEYHVFRQHLELAETLGTIVLPASAWNLHVSQVCTEQWPALLGFNIQLMCAQPPARSILLRQLGQRCVVLSNVSMESLSAAAASLDSWESSNL